jgi:hypothetical protein
MLVPKALPNLSFLLETQLADRHHSCVLIGKDHSCAVEMTIP